MVIEDQTGLLLDVCGIWLLVEPRTKEVGLHPHRKESDITQTLAASFQGSNGDLLVPDFLAAQPVIDLLQAPEDLSLGLAPVDDLLQLP